MVGGAIYDEGAITVIDGMDVEKADGALVTVSFTRKGTEIAIVLLLIIMVQ